MKTSPDNHYSFNVKLFDMLLLQFGGTEGELPMAIVYLTQATNETNAMRKAALIRIAREKIRHADLLGSMLLQMSQGRTGPLSTSMSRTDLRTLLKEKGLKENNHDLANDALEQYMAAEAAQSDEHLFASDSRTYLKANILTEDKQIAAYERLAHMTTDSNFISALNYAKSRQLEHRAEFVDLLRRATGH